MKKKYRVKFLFEPKVYTTDARDEHEAYKIAYQFLCAMMWEYMQAPNYLVEDISNDETDLTDNNDVE